MVYKSSNSWNKLVGEVVETGQIEIPGSRVGDVINGLTKAAQGIQEKLNEDSSSVSTK